jgi:hypothetical protein
MSEQETDDESNRAISTEGPLGERELTLLRNCLRGLRFGSITLVVQEGQIVQMDRLDKRRLSHAPRKTRG